MRMAIDGMTEFSFAGRQEYKVAVLVIRKLEAYKDAHPLSERFAVSSTIYGSSIKVIIQLPHAQAELCNRFAEEARKELSKSGRLSLDRGEET